VEDGGFCGGAARCGCGVFLRLPPPATTETTLGNPPRPLFSSPPQPAARRAPLPRRRHRRLVGEGGRGAWFFQAVGKNLSPPLSPAAGGLSFFPLCRAATAAAATAAARTASRRTTAAVPTILPPMTSRGLRGPRDVFRTPSSLRRTTTEVTPDASGLLTSFFRR